MLNSKAETNYFVTVDARTIFYYMLLSGHVVFIILLYYECCALKFVFFHLSKRRNYFISVTFNRHTSKALFLSSTRIKYPLDPYYLRIWNFHVYVLVKSVYTLCNRILLSSHFSDIWKKANNCLILNCGDSINNLCNYRLTAIVCNLPKLLEITYDCIYSTIQKNLSLHQFGLISRKSTRFVSEVSYSQGQVDLIYR